MNEVIKCIAVGDSMGLSYEGLAGSIEINKKQHFLFNAGLTSDDTQHASLTYIAIKLSNNDSAKFRNILGSSLAKWLICCPPGIGFATLRSGLKLLCGFRSPRSGVFSAGNGPAMRSTVIGVFFHDNPSKLEEFVRISTTTTHTDPKAITASLSLAKIAAYLYNNKTITIQEIVSVCSECGKDKEWMEIISKIEKSQSFDQFLHSMNLKNGASGYIYHTVPVAIMLLYYYKDAGMQPIFKAIEIGGDTDSTAAVVGGLMGASGFVPPQEFLKIHDLSYQTQVRYSWAKQIWWNLVLLLAIILKHLPIRILWRTSSLFRKHQSAIGQRS